MLVRRFHHQKNVDHKMVGENYINDGDKLKMHPYVIESQDFGFV